MSERRWINAIRIDTLTMIREIILDDELDSFEKAVKIEDLMYEAGFMEGEE